VQFIAAMFCRAFGYQLLPSSLTSTSQSFLNQLPWAVIGTTQPYPMQPHLLMGSKISPNEQLLVQHVNRILNSTSDVNSLANSSLDKFGAARDLSALPSSWSKLWSGRLSYGRVLVDSTFALGDSSQSFYSKCGIRGVEGLILEFAEIVQPKSLVLKATVKADVSLRIVAKTMPKRQHSRHVLHDDQPTSRVVHTRKTYSIDAAGVSTVSELRQQIRPRTLLTSAWSYVDSETREGWVELWAGTGAAASTVHGQSLGQLKFEFCLPNIAAWFETRTLIVEVCGSIGQAFGQNLDASPLEGVFAATLEGTKGGTSSGRVVSPSGNIIYM
jgi:hypothetical protein